MSFPRKKVKWSPSKTLEFLSIDWIECDEIQEKDYDDYETFQDSQETEEKEIKHNKNYTIFVFGVTSEGYSVCVKITNYNPYFFIKIPELLLNNKPFLSSMISFGPLGQSLDNTRQLVAIASIKTNPGSSQSDESINALQLFRNL